MKICMITDTHFGIRGSSDVFAENQAEFYEKVFFPYIDEHGIDTVIHLGDVFDRRKHVDFKTLSQAREMFFDELARRNIKLVIILGNHCVYFKNKNFLNSPGLLLTDYDNITIIDNRAETIELGGVKIDLLPWFYNELYADVMDHVANSDAEFACAHLELTGFLMSKNNPSTHGQDASLFKRYKRVFTGHYHKKSSKGNIDYLGAPTQYTWIDEGEERGFHVFDTVSKELTFIPNPYAMFHKIAIDKTFKASMVGDHLTNKYVRLVQSEHVTTAVFEKVADKVMQYNPHELDLVSQNEMEILEDNIVEWDEISTDDAIVAGIDGLQLDEAEKDSLKTLLIEIHQEALLSE